jgi:adenine-specific DNA-methyltransferase
VTGRFTVESLSPHRVLEEDETDEALASDPEVVQFETMILDNLRKAGVQNTYKGERMQFDRLEPLPGRQWLQAEGEYPEADGSTRRVAISLGPEFGTVGSEQVALAAQEATRGIPYDVLLVTGFAFDPQAWAKAKEINPDVAERSLGRLRVLLVRANPDLAMGGELLKKTGAGNLFSIFGEPDIDIRVAGGDAVVEIRGLDVYDPTTGAVRSASTEDIACWFIDTSYDGTSFFVRHAYFTGGQQPYENLAKTLRAEIDPDAWASLYSTASRPFPLPASGRIAVKVINHYGDEVLQVYEVGR